MFATFTADQVITIREGVRRQQARAVAREQQLETLVKAAEADVRHATLALSQHRSVAAHIGQCERALDAQLQRSEEGLALARLLCVAAREDHLAINRVVLDLRDERPAEASVEPYAARHAVLLVDDHDDSRELLSIVLADAGFIVRTASNGLEAVIAAYEMRPSVIVMDVNMPVLDGVEATRLIKTIDTIRDARVIAYTAQPDFDDRARTLFAAVLKKPALAEVVVAAIQQHV